MLYVEGAEATHVYIVAEGSLRSIRTDADGREQVLSVERTGCILGTPAIFMEGTCMSTAVVEESVAVLAVETPTMRRLCKAHPELLWIMATALASRVRAYIDLAAMLSLRNVDQKLAQYLVTVAQDRGIQTDEGCAFELTATRFEIATRLGSVREVISRSMAHLQDRGLIILRGRLVTVASIAALQRFASGEKHSRAQNGAQS
jgi:CRP/FNR family cyclic AMP-dependent transcriptional regulator